MKRGFTLIELLVVVLIIGILASVALPQYQKAVEKSRMVEAVALVQTIAKANQVYFMENGQYADFLEQLDVQIPGTPDNSIEPGRVKTKDFIYSTTSQTGLDIAQAQHVYDPSQRYRIHVQRDNPDKIRCSAYATASAIQTKLCQLLQTKGTL